ncbi:hypothetical protein BB8028_0008g00440 [Beauveria bassiana]|uniref:Uncharacterized protein n=1 Tax=Beauveria bassiana TaxID=176275 RepID=A0A2S7YNI6_BEABA|nr:hypothetical protein BB8028_0008g00440 [Beauveria bassiana]
MPVFVSWKSESRLGLDLVVVHVVSLLTRYILTLPISTAASTFVPPRVTYAPPSPEADTNIAHQATIQNKHALTPRHLFILLILHAIPSLYTPSIHFTTTHHVLRGHFPRRPRHSLPSSARLGQARHLQCRLAHQHPPLPAGLHPRDAARLVHHRKVPRTALRVRGAEPGRRGRLRPRSLRLRPAAGRPAPAAAAAASWRHELWRHRTAPQQCIAAAAAAAPAPAARRNDEQ